jgi:RNA polymerase sigma factor (sigma-70 family)
VEGRPLDTEDDDQLVARAQRGEVHAYERLLRRHQDLAFRTAFLVTRSRSDAEDAAQEGFVTAWHALDRFRPGAPFRPWLLAIVANEARNRIRSARRQESLTLRAAEDRPSGDAAPSPEAAALASERRKILLAAVNRLSESDREMLACRYFMELSEAETASVLGCRRGTVKSRTSRALGRLRAILAEQGVAQSLWPATEGVGGLKQRSDSPQSKEGGGE